MTSNDYGDSVEGSGGPAASPACSIDTTPVLSELQELRPKTEPFPVPSQALLETTHVGSISLD